MVQITPGENRRADDQADERMRRVTTIFWRGLESVIVRCLISRLIPVIGTLIIGCLHVVEYRPTSDMCICTPFYIGIIVS